MSRALAILLVLTLAGCEAVGPHHGLIPAPMSFEAVRGEPFQLWLGTRIIVDAGDAEALRVGGLLSDLLTTQEQARPMVAEIGSPSETAPASDTLLAPGERPGGVIRLTRGGVPSELGDEGYELEVRQDTVWVRAETGAGLFYGVQTLRMLLPGAVEYRAAYPRPFTVPRVRIRDRPRFAWRGAMLDVARHFRTVDEVKRLIDLMVPYKLNRLHLHLSDDQGWRVEIPGWPNLTAIGGRGEVGGGPGGFYTVADYDEIVRYAAERYVTVVPEIDAPGHINAALASYPELNCNGVAPPMYAGTAVGFSSLCVEKDVTYQFLDDVVTSIAARTPGPWFHMGGDEVEELTEEEYALFFRRMSQIIAAHGKELVGWDEIAATGLAEDAIVQLWRPLLGRPLELVPEGSRESARRLEESVRESAAAGARFILSPADRVYLDMKYDSTTAIGLTWAGTTDERAAYDWRVAERFHMIPESSILGVEGPLWSESIGSVHDVEYMAFPRLAAVAEIGWSPEEARDWRDYRQRLAAQAPRWRALGVNFRRTPGIEWKDR